MSKSDSRFGTVQARQDAGDAVRAVEEIVGADATPEYIRELLTGEADDDAQSIAGGALLSIGAFMGTEPDFALVDSLNAGEASANEQYRAARLVAEATLARITSAPTPASADDGYCPVHETSEPHFMDGSPISFLRGLAN